MKIGLNLRPLFPGKIGGLEHHFRGLFDALLRLDSHNQYTLYVHADNAALFERYRPRVQLHPLPDPHQLTHLATAVRDSRPDIVFHPFLFIEPIHLDALSAVLIPDVRYAHYPEQIPPAVLAAWRELFPASARRAEVVFTLSEDSRRDVSAILGVPEEKIQITSPAVDPIFFAPQDPLALLEVKTRLQLPDRFLFYPADTWPHKNHLRLFEALRRLRARGLEIPLVLSGFPNAGEPAVQRALQSAGLRNQVIRLGYVKRSDLPAIYRLSTALVFPSMYEGWGMPVSEAMAVGTPVLCSRATSIPEVGGEAARYFNPLDVADMADQIQGLWSDAELRERLARLGPQQARAYTWEKAAATTLHALERAAAPRLELADPLPLFSIVTPSFQQGRFIERTIESVLSQDYPNIEYLVLDGGSRDETVSILKKHGGRIRWVSRPDRGQSDAINQGLRASRGEILAYLNSDDTYTPGALRKVAAHMVANPSCDLLYGRGWHIDADDRVLEAYPTEPFDAARLATRSFICQPTAFWRRRLHDRIGYFDEAVHFVMDYEFWMRAAKAARIVMLDDYLANSRLWEENKTLGSRKLHLYQAMEVVHRHYRQVPRHWLHAYADFCMTRGADGGRATSRPAARLRRLQRQWLLTRLDARFNGLHTLGSGLFFFSQAAAPPEGFDDGWMGVKLVRKLKSGAAGRRLRIRGSVPAWPESLGLPRLTVYADRLPLGEFRLTAPGPFQIDFAIPEALASQPELQFILKASDSYIPSSYGMGADDRRLSVQILSLSLEG